MFRLLLVVVLLLAVAVQLAVQFSVDKRGAAWFLRPNWRPPAKRFFYPDTGASMGSDYDQYIVY